MYVGILTAPFSKEPLEHVAAFAGEYGFGGMEVATEARWHDEIMFLLI